MNLLPSPEQQAIVAAAAAFLAKELPAPAAVAGAPPAELGRSGARTTHKTDPQWPAPAVDRVLWARMGTLGWFALGLPEDAGGAGYGVAEEALLFRELGRALAPGPFLAQVLAVQAATAAGNTGLAAALAAGDTVAGLAEPLGDGYRLLDAAGADVLAVVAGEGVALVEAGAATERVAQPGLDPSPSVELAKLDPRPAPAAGDLVRRGQVLVAAMLAGICEATRDHSAAYAKVREQFGKPIGTFQAVKHRCADMAVRAEAAAGLTFLAALSLQDRTPEAPALAVLTKALASEHALANAADDIQNHGGTGFTADCPAHHYLKRANVLATVLGTPAALYAEAGRS